MRRRSRVKGKLFVWHSCLVSALDSWDILQTIQLFTFRQLEPWSVEQNRDTDFCVFAFYHKNSLMLVVDGKGTSKKVHRGWNFHHLYLENLMTWTTLKVLMEWKHWLKVLTVFASNYCINILQSACQRICGFLTLPSIISSNFSRDKMLCSRDSLQGKQWMVKWVQINEESTTIVSVIYILLSRHRLRILS